MNDAKKYYEVVVEFLDDEGNVRDFTVIDGGFASYDDALACAVQQEAHKDDGEQIVIYDSDKDGSVLDSWVIK